jgi:amino acid adenylation domain-containing protein
MSLSTSSARSKVLSSIAKALGVPVKSIDTSKCFTGLGGHSLSAVSVQHECKFVVSNPPTALALLTSPSIEELLPPGDSEDCEQWTRRVQLAPPAIINSSCASSTYSIATDESLEQQMVREKTSNPTGPDRVQLKFSATTQDLGPTEAMATDMQAALIMGSRSTIQYFETWRLEDLIVIKYAWKTVISMEPIFRVIFDQDAQGVYTMRIRDAEIPWEEIVTFDRQSYQKELAKAEIQSQPTFRFKSVVYKAPGSENSEATIVLAVHHALLDGWSMERLVAKVRRVASGQTDVEPGMSFLAAARALSAIKKDCEPAARESWARLGKSHSGFAAGLGMRRSEAASTDPTSNTSNEVNVDFEHIGHRLQDRAKELGVTLACLFHVAWALVQAMYADSSKVVFGTILSGRNLAVDGIDTAIGPMLNLQPLHICFEADMSTDALVRRVFSDMVELSSMQWSLLEHGFGHAEAALSVTRGLDTSSHHAMRPIRPARYDFQSDIPLCLALDEAAMSLRVVYHADKYSASIVKDLADSFVSALERLTYTTSMADCLDLVMTVPLQGRLRVLGNCISASTTRGAHWGAHLVSLFDSVVQNHAMAPALECGERQISYAELDALACEAAVALDKLHVEGQVVCVHADASVEWIVGLLGALKAGATMCSLDATLPHDLRSDMFAAAGSSVFIVGHESQRDFQPANCSICLVLPSVTRKGPVTCGDINPTAAAASRTWDTPRASQSPAYLCFTSGSTGKPKGVLCTHQALAAFQKDVEVRLHAGPGVRVAQFMSPAFDGSIHEIFSALCYGATLVLRSVSTCPLGRGRDDTPRGSDPFEVLHRASSAIMTPSVACTLIPTEYGNLETIYLVGEQVPQWIVDQWAPGRKLYNMYGPTEGTGGATITRLVPQRPVTIGRPNPTSRVYVLSQRGRLMPPGAIGEIYIAGVQVAVGYANLPQETAARFLPDTVCPGLVENMYRTGDRGYWNDAGELVCLGRNDRQVKLRGFRLDLDDLEVRILKALPDIQAVALTTSMRGDTLVAMVQPASLQPDTIITVISQKLPKHAVPSALVCVDVFPMTRAGKIDVKAMAASIAAH